MSHRSPDLALERALWQAGIRYVAGVDEAGRGALAGPVAAAAVILPPQMPARLLEGVNDSKRLSPARREALAQLVRQVALTWAVGFASPEEIDRWGILCATRLAVRRALVQLTPQPEFLLLDYLHLPEVELPQVALPRGDGRVLSVAAASLVAKTARDAWMRDLERQYPGYGFARHKGYGTRAHRQALSRLGPSPAHRRSFRWKPEAQNPPEP